MTIARRIRYYLYGVFEGSLDPESLCLLARTYGIEPKFVIEAGSHDGSDTEVFASIESIDNIYGFEPDSQARKIAANRTAQFHQISISNFGLTDYVGFAGLKFENGVPGTGSTRVVINPQDAESLIPVVTLDSYFGEIGLKNRQGLLWLDVEGMAVNVLKGGWTTLRHIAIAKIEVEFQRMSVARNRNYISVMQMMKSAGFYVVKSTVSPSTFGDLIFIHRDFISPKKRFYARILESLIGSLHTTIYPTVRRTEKVSTQSNG